MADGLSTLRILVIDDNAQMRTIIGTVLAAVGVRNLYYAQDGRDALEVMTRQPIDIIYVDLEMPVMNGLQFIAAVRALSPPKREIPIIMLTGHCDVPSIVRARDAGVNEFLGKPVTVKSILQRLSEVIFRPRGFVTSPDFAGPNRRRRSLPSYDGPKRRSSDIGATIEL